MKKIIILSTFLLSALCGFSQISTISKQDAQMVKQDTAAARLLTLQKAAYIASTSSLQTVGNATLTLIKKGLDTLNQSERLQATAALQTAANATLVNMKKSLDTLNQSERLQATAALQTINNATLTLIKKGVDTLNQSERLQATAALQTAANATLVNMKKSLDTLNQKDRQIKNVLDSINQATKIKTVTASITSTNTGETYNIYGQISGGSTIGYSVSVGSGNYRLVKAIMYPTSSSTALDVNVSIFTASITTGADNTTWAASTTFNSRYAGTIHFSTLQPFTSSQVYSTRQATGSGIGDENILVIPSAGVMWFFAWANSAFTPPSGEVYNFKFFLEKVN